MICLQWSTKHSKYPVQKSWCTSDIHKEPSWALVHSLYNPNSPLKCPCKFWLLSQILCLFVFDSNWNCTFKIPDAACNLPLLRLCCLCVFLLHYHKSAQFHVLIEWISSQNFVLLIKWIISCLLIEWMKVRCIGTSCICESSGISSVNIHGWSELGLLARILWREVIPSTM